MRSAALLPIILLGACSTAGGPYPSLQPRAAEEIDPRVPVTRPMNDRDADPALLGFLAASEKIADDGNAAFQPAAAEAERLAASAGAPQSESWIAAQEALTAAIAARRLTAQALGDIDERAATMLQVNRGIAPSDLSWIQRVSEKVSAIDRRQAERIDAIQKRLGL